MTSATHASPTENEDASIRPGDGKVDALTQFAYDLIEAWNAHDARRVVEFFSPDYVGEDVGVAGQLHGPRDIRRYVAYNFLGFPDLYFTLERTIAQGDQLVIVWCVTGTHRGKVMNIPPTGRRVEARGVSILTINDGKIVTSYRIWDVAGMLRQIGLLPDLPSIG